MSLMPSTSACPIPSIGGQPPASGVREVWDDAEARFYMEGISRSDYARAVGGRLHDLLGSQAELLDIGAGAGTLGLPLLAPGARWTAVEPNAFLAGHLRSRSPRWPYRLNVVESTWQALGPGDVPMHDASVAANTCGPLDDPEGFWWWMRARTERVMAWVVPAQEGPHGICLSGFLPPELHGEDMEPPARKVLARLGDHLRPDHVEMVDWTFHYRFADAESANRYFNRRFNPAGDPARAHALSAHLEENLVPVLDGQLASAPKRSACLIWFLSGEQP
jgi:hypothetical protein